MTQFEPVPTESAVEDVRQQWASQTDTFSRLYHTVLAIDEYTHNKYIASTADCSVNTAKKHLDRLAEMGLVEKPEPDSTSYRRNDAYFEWREASRIADERSHDEIASQVRRLESQNEEYESKFDTDDPSSVTVFDHPDHETVHSRLEAISEWRGIKRDMRLLELAAHLARNDGHLIRT